MGLERGPGTEEELVSEQLQHPEDAAPSAQRSPEERRALLAQAVSSSVSSGYRVESQTDYQAIIVKGRRPSHGLHLFLSIITLGVWALLVWLPLALFGGERRRVLSVDSFGNVATAKGRG